MTSGAERKHNIRLVSGGESDKKAILVVEDDEVALDLLAEILRRSHFHVWTAASVHAAVDLLKKTRVDLVLSDIRMPDQGGMDLLRHIRESHSEIPVVLLSAFGDEHLWVEALSAGAVDLIPKPFRKQEIIDVINKTLAG
ncbi:MAG: response regulator [Leptospirales bacterium]